MNTTVEKFSELEESIFSCDSEFDEYYDPDYSLLAMTTECECGYSMEFKGYQNKDGNWFFAVCPNCNSFIEL